MLTAQELTAKRRNAEAAGDAAAVQRYDARIAAMAPAPLSVDELSAKRENALAAGDEAAVQRYNVRIQAENRNKDQGLFASPETSSNAAPITFSENDVLRSLGADPSTYLSRADQESLSAANTGLARDVAGGATFEFGDQIEAAGRSTFGKDTFQESLDKVQSEKQAFSKEYPALSTAANIAGTLSGPAALGKKLLGKGAEVTAKRVAGAAAAEGAIIGAGKSNTLEELPGKVVVGAALSGLFGFAGTKVIQAGGTLIAKARNFIANAREHKYQEGLKELGEAMVDDGLSATNLEKAMEELGDDSVLADLGTSVDAENIARLTDQAFLQGGKAAQGARKFVNNRTQAMVGRVEKAIKNTVGDFDNYIAKVDNIIEKMRTVAKPIYDAAYEVPIKITPKLIKAMTIKNNKGEVVLKDVVSDAWKEAKKLANTEGITLGNISSADITTREIDYIKRGLDTVIENGTDITGKLNSKARAVAILKKEIIDEVDTINPLYKQAREVFEGEFKLKRALESGLKAVKNDTEVTVKLMKGMTASEKDMFRQGYAKALSKKISDAPNTVDAYKRIAGNETAKRNIRAIVGEENAASLIAKLENEAAMHGTRASFGNSKTVLRKMTTAKQKAAQALEGISPLAITKKALNMALGSADDSVKKRGDAVTRIMFAEGLDQKNIISELKRFEAAAIKNKSPSLTTIQAAIIAASAAQFSKDEQP